MSRFIRFWPTPTSDLLNIVCRKDFWLSNTYLNTYLNIYLITYLKTYLKTYLATSLETHLGSDKQFPHRPVLNLKLFSKKNGDFLAKRLKIL